MEEQLEDDEFDVIFESLKHYKLNIESTEYPSYEFRRKQLERVEFAMRKVKALKNQRVSRSEL
jgi:hypothetical protein